MNIALCFSGQPRNVEQGFQYIKAALLQPNSDKHNIDVHVHTWYDPKWAESPPLNSGGNDCTTAIPTNIIDTIKELYHPMTMVVEPPRQFNERNYNERKLTFINVSNSLSQRWSIRQAFTQSAYTKKYDAYIRMRFDWLIQTPFLLNRYPLPMVKTIYVPDDCPHVGGINDQFAYGTYAAMNEYSKLYTAIDDIYNNHKVTFADELLLGKHLELTSCDVVPTYIPYRISRG